MSVRYNIIRDSLMFYELLEEAESVEELNASIEQLVEAFRSGICDLCSDNDWNIDDIESEIM